MGSNRTIERDARESGARPSLWTLGCEKMKEVLATTELFGESKDRGRFPIRVQIGRPYLSGTEPDTWACPVAIDPLYTHLRDIAGGDSFQALCLASRTAISLLESFVQSGGRLTHDDGTAYSLDAYGLKISDK